MLNLHQCLHIEGICSVIYPLRVETNIDRDPSDRKRMAALAYGASRGRRAASNFSVEEVLAGGGAALVRWKLDTGAASKILRLVAIAVNYFNLHCRSNASDKSAC